MRISMLAVCAFTIGAAFGGQNPPKLATPPPGFGPPAPAPQAKQPDKSKASAKEKTKAADPAPKANQGTAQRAQRTAAPPAAPVKGAYGPGQDVGDGFRACVPGDTTPAGTVKQGYRKFEANTPFGHSCRWEKAQGAPDSAPPAAAVAENVGPLPGVDVGGGYRGCAASDNAAPGTEQNGYRKVVAKTPFGQTCRWEPIQGEGAAPASAEFRPCDAKDTSPAGTVRDGFRKVEGMTVAGKTCRWERTSTAQ